MGNHYILEAIIQKRNSNLILKNINYKLKINTIDFINIKLIIFLKK